MPHASGVPSRRTRRQSCLEPYHQTHEWSQAELGAEGDAHVDLGSLGYGLLGRRDRGRADHRLTKGAYLP